MSDNPIKRARNAAGMTQKQLAEAAGLNLRTIQKYEYGERDTGAMEARNLLAIADALGVDPHNLIYED